MNFREYYINLIVQHTDDDMSVEELLEITKQIGWMVLDDEL